MALRAVVTLPGLVAFVAAVVAGRIFGVVAALAVLGVAVLLIGLGVRSLNRAGHLRHDWYRDR